MTEELLPLFSLTFFLGGCCAAFAAIRSSPAGFWGVVAGFAVLTLGWLGYGYAVTGDLPTSVGRALAHAALYGPGFFVFGGVPSAFGFAAIYCPMRKR
jgi:hypothetical protein